MATIDPVLTDLRRVSNLYALLSSGYAEPFDGDFTFLKALYFSARGADNRVVLDGGGGDALLSEGSYIPRLIRQGHWRTATAEISAERKFWDGALGPFNFARYLRAALVPDSFKALYRRIRPGPSAGAYLKDSLIAPYFARRINIEERFARLREMFPAAYGASYPVERCGIIRPNVSAGRERYVRIAASAGIEARSPFLDKRVVEFSAWLPGHLRLKDGWPKIVLRNLMSERLPKEVVWGRGRHHLGWRFNAAVTREAIDRGEIQLARLEKELESYVDKETLAAAWTAFGNGSNVQPLQSARVLFIWLGENVTRPVVAR
jgi:asparagine synthase (glutamine-hydrolysing)